MHCFLCSLAHLLPGWKHKTSVSKATMNTKMSSVQSYTPGPHPQCLTSKVQQLFQRHTSDQCLCSKQWSTWSQTVCVWLYTTIEFNFGSCLQVTTLRSPQWIRLIIQFVFQWTEKNQSNLNRKAVSGLLCALVQSVPRLLKSFMSCCDWASMPTTGHTV